MVAEIRTKIKGETSSAVDCASDRKSALAPPDRQRDSSSRRHAHPIDAATHTRLQHFPDPDENAGHPEGRNNGDEDGAIAERVPDISVKL